MDGSYSYVMLSHPDCYSVCDASAAAEDADAIARGKMQESDSRTSTAWTVVPVSSVLVK